MRTFSTEAQAAMDSGIFEAYVRVGVVDTDPNNFQEWIEPIQYKLTDTELEVVFPIEGAGTYASDSPYVALRRGVYINGIPETTTTTSFFVTSIIKDERFFYYKASILPNHYKKIGTDLTYSEVIENIYLDELNPTVKIIKPTYEVPAHAVWGYLFYPSGRNIIFNSLRSLSTILRQKFLIFLRHTENTYSSKTDIFFYQPTETRAVDYEITDLLYKLPTGGRQINKRLLWRDDSASVTIYDPGSGSGEKYPIHNLGYIPTTGTRPSYKSSPPIGGKSSKLSPNLKYETGDYVTINNHTGSFSYRIKVTEIFDANAPMAWYVIVEPIVWFDNTEGGALPSTIEASAPFTPLNTSTFNNNLDASVNNLQALAEAVDNLTLGGTYDLAADIHAATSKATPVDADELGIWDSVADALKKLTWANLKSTLKTYFDTLYSLAGHSHSAPDASVVTYTPADATDWNSSSDPGDVDNALDQLADRTKTLEGSSGSGNGWTTYNAVVPTRVVSPLDGTFTVTIATPAVFTKTAHGLITGSKIRLTTSGALPTGLATGTDYYVVKLTADTFGVSTSLANAVAETPTRVNTSGTQSGTHSFVHQTDPAYWLQFAGVDLTATLYFGMPIYWTQNSITRYGFICTTPSYSGGNTKFMVLTRCDGSTANYDVLDTGTYTISDFHYGLPKLPGLGFPISSTAWTLSISDANFNSKASPTAGTTYNPGNIALMLTPGLWLVSSGGRAWTTFPSTPQRSVMAGCSSSQSSFSDSELMFTFVAEGTTVVAQLNHVRTEKNLSSETCYFHLVRTDTASATTIQQGGASGFETYVKGVSAFL